MVELSSDVLNYYVSQLTEASESIIDVVVDLAKIDDKDPRINQLSNDISDMEKYINDSRKWASSISLLKEALKKESFESKEKFLVKYDNINLFLDSKSESCKLVAKMLKKLKENKRIEPINNDGDIIMFSEKISLKCPITQVQFLCN
ncbi:hypothetical protein MXB_5690 [Myxobolus squamalis]|nr:hypothetical protein MXB_5690 [Myxobolus squamalis]